ncbi:hypothetical protein ACSFA7_22535 [Variovorax sp. LT1R20]
MTGEQSAQSSEPDDEDDEALTEGERVRRVALLTHHCIDNIACYRAGWATNSKGERHVVVQRNFWIRANGNFLDIAVSEWCKVFADKKSKHHFARVIPEPATLLAGLTAALGMDEAAYGALIDGVREYRDKFVAHLDDQRVMNVPAMQPLLDSAVFLYDTLCTNEATVVHLTGLRPDAKEFYDQRFAEALAEYRRAVPPAASS